MAIPSGRLFPDSHLKAGMLATTEPTKTNSTEAGTTIHAGQAVKIDHGKAVPATGAPIYGIARAKRFTNGSSLNDDNDWLDGEMIPVLRDGSIWVNASSDVENLQDATVDANGNFKVAESTDFVVGTFKDDALSGETVPVEITVQRQQPAAGQSVQGGN